MYGHTVVAYYLSNRGSTSRRRSGKSMVGSKGSCGELLRIDCKLASEQSRNMIDKVNAQAHHVS